MRYVLDATVALKAETHLGSLLATLPVLVPAIDLFPTAFSIAL